MRTVVYISLILLNAASICAAIDPINDYLTTFSPLDGDKKIYSDDRLLRLDLDLNDDGRQEVLLSMARDCNGKQGNVWVIYKQTPSGYVQTEGMTFNANRFYLGRIESIGKYGLICFFPDGANEGQLHCYVFDGDRVESVRLGEVVRNASSDEAKKAASLWQKYLGEETTVSGKASVIDAQRLANDYGAHVEARTYMQAFEAASSLTPSPAPTTGSPAADSADQSASPTILASPTPAETQSPALTVSASLTPVESQSPVVAISASPTPAEAQPPDPTVSASFTPAESQSPAVTMPSPTPSETPQSSPSASPSPTPLVSIESTTLTPAVALPVKEDVSPTPTPSPPPSPTPGLWVIGIFLVTVIIVVVRKAHLASVASRNK